MDLEDTRRPSFSCGRPRFVGLVDGHLRILVTLAKAIADTTTRATPMIQLARVALIAVSVGAPPDGSPWHTSSDPREALRDVRGSAPRKEWGHSGPCPPAAARFPGRCDPRGKPSVGNLVCGAEPTRLGRWLVGYNAGPSRRRPRVRVPSAPQEPA